MQLGLLLVFTKLFIALFDWD